MDLDHGGDFLLFSHIIRDSSTDRRFYDILWIIAVSEIMVFAILAVLNAVCSGVRIYSRIRDPRLYPSPDIMPEGGLG